jgi:hypothetical protein
LARPVVPSGPPFGAARSQKRYPPTMFVSGRIPFSRILSPMNPVIAIILLAAPFALLAAAIAVIIVFLGNRTK